MSNRSAKSISSQSSDEKRRKTSNNGRYSTLNDILVEGKSLSSSGGRVSVTRTKTPEELPPIDDDQFIDDQEVSDSVPPPPPRGVKSTNSSRSTSPGSQRRSGSPNPISNDTSTSIELESLQTVPVPRTQSPPKNVTYEQNLDDPHSSSDDEAHPHPYPAQAKTQRNVQTAHSIGMKQSTEPQKHVIQQGALRRVVVQKTGSALSLQSNSSEGSNNSASHNNGGILAGSVDESGLVQNAVVVKPARVVKQRNSVVERKKD